MTNQKAKGFARKAINTSTSKHGQSIPKLMEAGQWVTALEKLYQSGFSDNATPNKKDLEMFRTELTCHYYCENYEIVIEKGNKWIEVFPDELSLLVIVASSYRITEKYKASLRMWEKAINLSPGDIKIEGNYANCLRDAGLIDQAIEVYEKAINGSEHTPVELYKNYLIMLTNNNRNKHASNIAKMVYENYQENVSVTMLYAENLRALGDFSKAIKIMQAVNLGSCSKKELEEYYFVLSNCHDGKNESKQALAAIQKAINYDPSSAVYRMQLAFYHSVSGELEEAKNQLLKVIEMHPLHCEAHRRYSVIVKYDKNHKHYQELKKIYSNEKGRLSQKDMKALHFALAKAEEEANCLPEAEYHLKEANKLMNEEIKTKFDLKPWMNQAVQQLELDRALCKSEIQANREQNQGKELVFIVGMPRSGSTLTENVLTMSPNSRDLGETIAFTRVIDEASLIAEKNSKLTGKDLDFLADLYYEYIETAKADYNIITDKNLYNWRYAGLIAHIFPAAKIIHCYRNPIDNMLSIYKASFPSGNEYAFDLESIYKVYQLQEQCMRYYKQRHPNQVVSSCYDDLVTNPDYFIKELTASLGLEWNDAFLRPQDNQRKVRTASLTQVRGSIHKKSVQGWKRYETLLRPYADGFAKLGYKID